MRRDRFAPAGAALILALPLAGLGATAYGAGTQPVAAQASESLPGLDSHRLLVPRGELAGRAVQVSEVTSRLEPFAALARVEQHWRGQQDAAVLRAESGSWSVLSRQLGEDGYETLQLRRSPEGGSEGFLARWAGGADPAASRGRSSAHLLPDEARAVRQLASRDAGADGPRAAETLIASLPHSIDEAELRIDRHLRRRGFVDLRGAGQRRDLRWRSDRARFYHSAGAELLVTLHAQPQGTAVVLYHVRTQDRGASR